MKLTKLDVLGVLVVVAGLAGAFCVDAANAQTQVCGPGKDCVSRTFQTPTVPLSRFARCNRSRTAQIAFDADAGAYRVCNTDGGWGLLAAGGSSDSRWSWDGQYMSFDDDGTAEGGILRAHDTSATVYFTPGGLNIFAASEFGVRTINQTMQLSDTGGLSLNGQAPIYALPETTVWYDGPSFLSTAETYTQTASFSGAELHDICLIEQPGSAVGDGQISVTCAAKADLVTINWFNRGPNGTDPSCPSPISDCGRRVRLIQTR